MRWVEVLAALFMCHLVGDYLLQTDWQAQNKHGGLGRDRTSRRALLSHGLSYTLAFVPALIWLGTEVALGAVIAAAVAIAVPHVVQDDGRLIALYLTKVKGCDEDAFPFVAAAVDQTLHLVALFALAVLVAPG